MTESPTPDPSTPLEDFDGHSLEELSDYLERGRTPVDPTIEASPSCRIALAALERLRSLAGGLLSQDAAEHPEGESWVSDVVNRISLESRAGRSFPFDLDLPGVRASVTEGALRGLVRALGDSIPGLLTGRVRLEPSESGECVDVEVEASLFYGYSVPAAAALLRERVEAVLPRQAPFSVRKVDLRIRAIIEATTEDEG